MQRFIVGMMAVILFVTSLLGAGFHDAAGAGELNKVKTLLASGSDVNAKDANGNTPLLRAIWNKQLEVAKLLIRKGANINIRHRSKKNGSTPLYSAVQSGSPKMVSLLIKNGAKIHVRENGGRSMLTAISFGYFQNKTNKEGLLAVAELLIAKGVNVDEDNGAPLSWAVRIGNAKMVKLLVSKGADIKRKSKYGDTLLHVAASLRSMEIAKFLLKKGLDINPINKYGSAPLHHAAVNGRTELALLLMKKGANLNIKNSKGLTPLQVAEREVRLAKRMKRKTRLIKTVKVLKRYSCK